MDLTAYHERVIRGLHEEGTRLLFDDKLKLWSLVGSNGVLKEIIMAEYVDELVDGGLLKAVKPENLPEKVRASKEQILTAKAPKEEKKTTKGRRVLGEGDVIGGVKLGPGEEGVAIKVHPRAPSDNLNAFMGDLADAVKLLHEGYKHQGKMDEDLQHFVCGIMTVCRITERTGPDAFHEIMHAMEEKMPGMDKSDGHHDSVGKRLSSMLEDLLAKKKK